MAIPRSKKEEVVKKLGNIMKDAQTIVFVHFQGVNAEETEMLRDECIKEEVGYFVARKSLMKKAFENASIEGDFPELEGEIAFAYGEDQFAPARLVHGLDKKFKKRVKIAGGIFEGAIISEERMQDIASIPPLETLYAQFLTVIRAPIQGCASALNQIAEKKA